MKYILFLTGLVCGFATISNAQDVAQPDRPLPVPNVKGPIGGSRQSIPFCFEKGAFRYMSAGQKCKITENEKIQTKLTKVEIAKDGKMITGWKIDSNTAPEIKEYIWLDYSPMSLNKNLETSKANCRKNGAILPEYQELSFAADAGFLRLVSEVYFKDLTDAQLTKVRIRSNSVDGNRNSLSRKIKYDDNKDPLAKVKADSGSSSLHEGGYDISLCVIKNK